MRKILTLTILLISFCQCSNAQNVGIGTTTPRGKLEIAHDVYKKSPTVVLLDSGTMGWGPQIIFQNFNTLPNYLMMKASVGALATGSNSYMGFNYNGGKDIMTIQGDSKVGINKPRPEYALDVSGNSNVDGTLRINKQASLLNPTLILQDSSVYSSGGGVIQFKNTIPGGSTFNIKGGLSDQPYNSYMDFLYNYSPILTMTGDKKVGINDYSPDYTLDVSGELNIEDALRVSGNPGTAGQVLTSTGDGPPVWMSPAAPEITPRFMAYMFSNIVDNGVYDYSEAFDIVEYSIYNSNPADISIDMVNNTFNIIKPGIYHFDISGLVSTSANNMSYDLYLMNVFPGTNKHMRLVTKYGSNAYGFIEFDINFNVYIPAGNPLIFLTGDTNGALNERATFSNIAVTGYWVRD